ncbi:hypothetical protein A8C56_14670 [Niabella ginsenosidivorans]|uniref:histidine kinase n=1 Tax=Niabella ginsenosidivorans TaxID=1176587 RepID=A0A1A9I301_9BACT|nr:sensor histidine kinase [Niabella ginsenosidivorans]ANH82047.1 hypothetical protein A8C56_14670 [Niabella ginsenosidivorans]
MSVVLASGNTDSLRAIAGFLLSDYWSGKDSAKSKNYLDKGRLLAGNNSYLQALYLYYWAGYIFDADIDNSENLYRKADTLLQRFHTPDACFYRAKLWMNVALLEQYRDRDSAYLDILINKALPLAKQSGIAEETAQVYSNIRLMFDNIQEFGKADLYDSLALASIAHSKSKANRTVVNIYIESARHYIYEHKPGDRMLDSVYQLLKPYPEHDLLMDYYEYAAMNHFNKKDYNVAIALLDKGVALAEKLKNDYKKQSLQFQQYRVYTQQGKYAKARDLLLNAMQYSKPSYINNRMTMQYELSKTYERMGEYKKAFNGMEQYASILDSFYSAGIKNRANELETKFRTAEKEKQILALQSEKDKAALQTQRQKSANRLLAAACVFLLILAIAYGVYYKRISLQKEINHQQQVKDIEQKQQLKITQALLEGEERERQRVARDLHDGLGGMLAGVKINLSRQSKMEDQHLDKVIHQLDQSVSELRRIARNMMPESLLKIGLEAALRDLCESLSDNSTQIEFQAYDIEEHLPAAIQANIYRIVQEILSNAVRHATAKKIILQCSQHKKMFYITADDDGRGFDVSKISETKGIGFSNIKNRVEYLKGKMDIHSEIGEGTSINIELNLGT